MRRLRPLISRPPTDYLACLLAVAVGILVFLVASELFPVHSSNHDEGVYLQQAAMLLDGKLSMTAGHLSDAFRPWFFIQDGGRLTPRYAPIPAGMFAIGLFIGHPRVSLAFIAAGNVWLCYLLVATVFDRHRGLLAAVVFSVSPLFVLSSSVFLAYAPTTLLNLTFAVSYVYAARRNSIRFAILAGTAIGLSFFARPFTALLFAIPFIGHAAWLTWRGANRGGLGASAVRRNVATATVGLVLVGVAFTYNAYLTGNPLVFPYEAFAPNDGIGFGRRSLLGYSIEYTPSLALEANSYVVWNFVSRWFAGGLFGSALALGGIALVLKARVAQHVRGQEPSLASQLRLVLLGVLGTIVLGNLLFWGNVNILGSLSDPTDGLVSLIGPVYHFDALIPLSAFAAHGAVTAWTRLRSLAPRITPTHHKYLLVTVVVVSLVGFGGITVALVDAPVDRNARYTAKHQQIYEPFAHHPPNDALVFVPTPNGPWLNHPFQYLRNEPSLDGPIVFALDRDVRGNFDVIDAYPNRSYYRFTYHGTWTPRETDHVIPKLEPITVYEASVVRGRMTVGVPPNADHATVRLENTTTSVEYVTTRLTNETLHTDWILTTESARISGGDGFDPDGNSTRHAVQLADTETMRVSIQFVHEDGTSLTYEYELAVHTHGNRIRFLWPGEQYVCPIVERCGHSGTYLPTRPEVHLTGVSMGHEIRSITPAANTTMT